MVVRFQTLVLVLMAAAIGAAATGAYAEALRRGPYLQNVTTTAATLRWRTDIPSDSQVWLGTRPDSLSVAASDVVLNRNHQFRITGLEPGSRYYYAIGSSATRLAYGADYYFETAPASAEPTRIWVLGDSGTGTRPSAKCGTPTTPTAEPPRPTCS